MVIGHWVKRWEIPKSDNSGNWIVSLSDQNVYGCSCPVWKFKRQECKHIQAVKEGQFKEGEKIDPKEAAEARYRNLQKQGFRYVDWSSFRKHLEYRKQFISAFGECKIISYEGRFVLLIKNNEEFYKQELQKFLIKVKDFLKTRSKRIKNPSQWAGVDNTTPYWLTRQEYKGQLKKETFDLCQLLLFNTTGDINPNVSRETFDYLNSNLLQLQKKYGL